MEKRKLTMQERVVMLQEAIKADEIQKDLFAKNNQALIQLQKDEQRTKDLLLKKPENKILLKELEIIQDRIVERAQRVYDFSDDLTLDSMRELLAKLEEKLKDE